MLVSSTAVKIVAVVFLVHFKKVTSRPLDGGVYVNETTDTSPALQGVALSTPPMSQEVAKQVWMMSDKVWKLDLCDPGIRLKMGNRTLNKKSFYCNKNSAMKLAPMLIGDSLEDRVYVWCRMAALYSSVDETNNKPSKSFEVDDLMYFESDIVLSRENVDNILALYFPTPELRSASRSAARDFRKKNSARRKKRKIIRGGVFRWQNELVQYHIDKSFSSSARETILEAISEYEQATCIRFVPVSSKVRYSVLKFKNLLSSCSSSVGSRDRGETVVNIGHGCEYFGIITHEIGHALGFFHEHARPDRDDYVTVLRSNVKTNLANFDKQLFYVNTYGVPYDYSSVMHYGASEFGGNKMTIRTKDPAMQQVIGQRVSLSFLDVKLLNIAYCSKVCGQHDLKWKECQNGGYRNPNKCESCVCPEGLSPPFCENPSDGLRTAYTRFGGKSRQNNDRVEVDCGPQTLLATKAEQILTSPGYDTETGFGNNAYCPWLIKASTPGKRVYFQFLGKFHFHKEPNVTACEERIEVKYKELSLPGPRHCGFSTPKATYRSHGPELMVTGQTLNYTQNWQGFQAIYAEENCGGCSEDWTNQEPVCFRTEKYDCSQTIFFRFVENTCFRDIEYCCDGFNKVGDFCIREGYVPSQTTLPDPTPDSTAFINSTPKPTPSTSAVKSLVLTSTVEPTNTTEGLTTPTVENIALTTEPTVPISVPTTISLSPKLSSVITPLSTSKITLSTQSTTLATTQVITTRRPTRRIYIRPGVYIPLTNVWFPWSPWSDCSETCGLCGVRTRRRSCYRRPCSGPAEQREICGTPVCMEETIEIDYKCTKTKKNCNSSKGWFRSSNCMVKTTCKIKKMLPKCCQGEEDNGQCTIFFDAKRSKQS